MVSQVWYFEYILTDTEIEALALEKPSDKAAYTAR